MSEPPGDGRRWSADERLAYFVLIAADGDEEATAQVVTQTWRLVGFWARCQGLQEADVEDVRSRVFKAYLEQRATLRDPTRFPGWLRTVTHRKIQDLRRDRLSRVLSLNAPGAETLADELLIEAVHVGDELESSSILRGIPVEEVTVLRCKYIEGMSNEAIASLLEKTAGQVRDLVTKARRSLTERMHLCGE